MNIKIEEFIKLTSKLLYEEEGACGVPRPGMYKLTQEEFEIALNEYLSNGNNVLPELDALKSISWNYLNENSDISGPLEKIACEETFWNTEAYVTESQFEYLNDLFTNQIEREEIKKTYAYKRVNGFTPFLKKQVKERDKCCVKCSTSVSLEVDHIIPLFKGGENSLENLQLLCKKCHSIKTKRDKLK